MILIVVAYLAMATFAAGVASRAWRIARMPVHLRWELYPVPHEPNAAHGGSVFENLNWWEVHNPPNRAGSLRVMASEILLLQGVREHNRALWLRSYPFHGGLYLLAAFVLLLGLGGIAASLSAALAVATTVIGMAGFALLGLGALGLLLRRLGDPALRAHSASADFFNLGCFLLLAILGIVTFAVADRGFVHLRAFTAAVLTARPVALPALVVVEILAGLTLLVYLPFSHMSHFFTKWFTYHSVRWDDRANRVGSSLEAAVDKQLGAKVTWGAAHIGAGEGRNWVDVATAAVKR
jgi:nitrate reductase gamma subunit